MSLNSSFENLLFSHTFFIRDISFIFRREPLKAEIHVQKGYSEGSLFQFYFMQSRKQSFKE